MIALVVDIDAKEEALDEVVVLPSRQSLELA